jgi:GTP cyclohydrolase I
MLPVVGKAWVGYLPSDHICGLSKLGRLVEYYASQLTVQERVTKQIADFVESQLKPKGCMTVIRAAHMCMSFRGIRDGDAVTATSAVRGLFKESDSARAEFLSLIAGGYR